MLVSWSSSSRYPWQMGETWFLNAINSVGHHHHQKRANVYMDVMFDLQCISFLWCNLSYACVCNVFLLFVVFLCVSMIMNCCTRLFMAIVNKYLEKKAATDDVDDTVWWFEYDLNEFVLPFICDTENSFDFNAWPLLPFDLVLVKSNFNFLNIWSMFRSVHLSLSVLLFLSNNWRCCCVCLLSFVNVCRVWQW